MPRFIRNFPSSAVVPICCLILLCQSSCQQATQDEADGERPEQPPPFLTDDETVATPTSLAANPAPAFQEDSSEAIRVRAGESIQGALDRAADDPRIDRVVVAPGTYRPLSPAQALIWFNAKHDGITLEADGEVILTAANPDVANRNSKSYPAIVNHVVYFGDGINNQTTLRGFKITGANGYVTTKLGPSIQPDSTQPRLEKTAFFYTDGGGIKIFGRSYPTLEDNAIYDNYCSPCGAGISIEHRGYKHESVIIRNCVLRNNRSPLTGAALDLLDLNHGSSAVVENCLFEGNLSNCEKDEMSKKLGTWKPHDGHGALTVFRYSKIAMRNCTFVGNRNGVDDLSSDSTYDSCIFWQNDAAGGWPSNPRYEIDIRNANGITNCFVGRTLSRKMSSILDPTINYLDAADPDFDERFEPRNNRYDGVGYRVVSHVKSGEENIGRAE